MNAENQTQGGNLALILAALFRDALDANLQPTCNSTKSDSLYISIKSLILLYPVIEPELHLLDNNDELDRAASSSKVLSRDAMRFFASSYLPEGR